MNCKSLFFTAVFLVTSSLVVAQQATKKEITLEDIWQKGTFSQKSVYGFSSLKNGKEYTTLATKSATSYAILKYNYVTGKLVDTLLKSSDLTYNGKVLELADYSFSADENKLLIATEQEAIYRRSTKEYNYVYDRILRTVTPLSATQTAKESYATFSPDGTQIAFVRENNIFIKNMFSGREIQITKDGEKNKIINGSADWVYEEEFEFAQAFSWSLDGSRIAYYKFDEAAVKNFHLPIYDNLYPTDYQYKYPKAGEANAKVSIHVYATETKQTTTIDLGKETDQYIPRIKWTKTANRLCVLRMNRAQNQLDYLLANTNTGAVTVMLTEKSDTYVEIHDDLFFLPNSFITGSERSGYRHLYQFNFGGQRISQLTKGKFDVTAVYGVDENAYKAYYQTSEGSPLQRNVYSADFYGSRKRKLTTQQGTNNAVFSANFSYFLNYHTAAGVPLTVTLHDRGGKLIRTLENNTPLREKLSTYNLSKKEFFSFRTSDNTLLNGWMIKPTNFDVTKKYPVLMFVYGGPGSQTVTDSWGGSNDMWYHLLAAKGYMVVSVDGRGTGARGTAFKNCTYLDLGNKEVIDQTEAAKWLATQPNVDGTRIGIQGWSFGGYMSSLCITKAADVFKMAIAVAPVTNWRFYDSVYTERFLRTPQENKKGYDDNSPINFVEKLKGPYLLIHGTADDNVHFQNATEMIKELVKQNKKFDSAYYPDKNHGIFGGNTRLHLYTKMTDFIEANL